MFLNDRIFLPLTRQHHEQKCVLLSVLQRKYTKYKYVLNIKAARVLATIVWLIFSVFIVAFIFSSHIKQNPAVVYEHYINDNRIPLNVTENSTKQEFVYKTIGNWQLSAVKNVHMLPRLSSLRDHQWLRYPDRELFGWSEVAFNFVHDRLKDLDLENGKDEKLKIK